jgi:hypothetical protein
LVHGVVIGDGFGVQAAMAALAVPAGNAEATSASSAATTVRRCAVLGLVIGDSPR